MYCIGGKVLFEKIERLGVGYSKAMFSKGGFSGVCRHIKTSLQRLRIASNTPDMKTRPTFTREDRDMQDVTDININI